MLNGKEVSEKEISGMEALGMSEEDIFCVVFSDEINQELFENGLG
jgi:hypothetical protein